jgi:formate-dependent nitrite reductase cytochrome c552 subunit
MIEDALDWIEDHPNAKVTDIENEKDKVNEKVSPVIEKAKKRKELSDLHQSIKNKLKDENDSLSHLSSEERKRIKDANDELEKWLKENPDATKEEIEAKRKEFEDKVDPLLRKAQLRADLDELAKSYRDRVNDDSDCLSQLNSKEKKIIMDATQEILDWLKKNPNATEEELQEKIRQLQNKTRPIIERAEARKELETTANNLKERSEREETRDKIPLNDQKSIDKNLKEALEWLSDNYDASV